MADLAAPKTRLFQFGPFELDVRAGELRKHGTRLRLREQPFQILLMLLEHPGEIVLREEIRQRLWPNNTVVEFDHGINAAIQKLRDALGESADKPRYVETVARRGYRFLGEVERVGEPQAAAQPAAQPVAVDPGDLSGQVISHYRILGKLGAGGMGVVYRAEDLKLGRTVALKFLPCPIGEMPEAMLQRFEREARAASALNHPHICTIHGLEDFAGQPAIVMELVEGDTLAARLERGALPLDEALALAIQIAGALAEAHRKGVVHRDLKPANIMLTRSGAKVLDFGLAKMERAAAPQEATVTMAGTVLGTPHYMSPEQAQGNETDARSDIFSFGVVLHEMVTGRRAFDGASAASVMAAILEREPPALVPASLDRVVSRCLKKDPDERWQSAQDLIPPLRWVSDSADPSQPATLPQPALRTRLWIGAAALLGLAAAAGWIAFLRAGTGAPGADWKLSVVPPPGTELPSTGSYRQATPEISPDGTMIVCRLGEGLQLRKLNSTQFIPLRGTKDALEPFWAPDSQWIGFNVNGALMKMQVPDGAPELLWKGGVSGGTWGGTGTILVSGARGLQAIPATGGSATTLSLPEQGFGAFYPHFLPDGEHFLFFRQAPSSEGGPLVSNLYLGGWSGGKSTLPSALLRANCGEARYSPAHGGSVLFVQNDNLYAQKLNLARARLEGSPILVETPVAGSGGIYPDNSSFSVSANGVLAWRPGRVYMEQLTWLDRHGNALDAVGPPTRYLIARPSPDERRIAAVVWTPGGLELRVLETGQSAFLTILNPALRDVGAVVWRRDSLHLLYASMDSGESFLMERSATGSSEVRQLGKVPAMTLLDIAPDGTLLGMIHNTLHVVQPERDRTPRPLLASEEQTRQGAFSPDGHWVVYASALAQELFVQAFPISGPRRQISTSGGAMPYWRGDGKEILYLGADNWVYSVRSDPARGEFQPPERLFAVRIAPNSPNHFTLAATRDGSRILFDQAIDQPESRVINVALHP